MADLDEIFGSGIEDAIEESTTEYSDGGGVLFPVVENLNAGSTQGKEANELFNDFEPKKSALSSASRKLIKNVSSVKDNTAADFILSKYRDVSSDITFPNLDKDFSNSENKGKHYIIDNLTGKKTLVGYKTFLASREIDGQLQNIEQSLSLIRVQDYTYKNILEWCGWKTLSREIPEQFEKERADQNNWEDVNGVGSIVFVDANPNLILNSYHVVSLTVNGVDTPISQATLTRDFPAPGQHTLTVAGAGPFDTIRIIYRPQMRVAHNSASVKDWGELNAGNTAYADYPYIYVDITGNPGTLLSPDEFIAAKDNYIVTLKRPEDNTFSMTTVDFEVDFDEKRRIRIKNIPAEYYSEDTTVKHIKITYIPDKMFDEFGNRVSNSNLLRLEQKDEHGEVMDFYNQAEYFNIKADTERTKFKFNENKELQFIDVTIKTDTDPYEFYQSPSSYSITITEYTNNGNSPTDPWLPGTPYRIYYWRIQILNFDGTVNATIYDASDKSQRSYKFKKLCDIWNFYYNKREAQTNGSRRMYNALVYAKVQTFLDKRNIVNEVGITDIILSENIDYP